MLNFTTKTEGDCLIIEPANDATKAETNVKSIRISFRESSLEGRYQSENASNIDIYVNDHDPNQERKSTQFLAAGMPIVVKCLNDVKNGENRQNTFENAT